MTTSIFATTSSPPRSLTYCHPPTPIAIPVIPVIPSCPEICRVCVVQASGLFNKAIPAIPAHCVMSEYYEP